MVSRRIEDALEVLALMRERRKLGAKDSVVNLRLAATSRVAGRGVNETTVRAHLVGKNVTGKLSTQAFDRLATAWLDSGASELESWYLRDANPDELCRAPAVRASRNHHLPGAP